MYQALYRRYRPKSFEEILGQNHITRVLSNQVKMDNIGHAYLFSGTRGTGKTSAAKIFSRAVNCLSPVNGSPCNKCRSCKEILEETGMDIIEMDAASHNSVNDIRDLRDKVVYAPARIKYKVYIVDEVHMLSNSAFNALLKTLEEPPRHLIFILATTEPAKLPQTILSRCQRFDFRRLSTRDIILNMETIIDDLDIQVDDESLKLIARKADGAMRDALSLLDQCLSYDGQLVSYEDAIDILGIVSRDLIFNMVDNIKKKKLDKVLASLDQIIESGKDIQQLIKDIINHFRNLMLSKSSKNPQTIIEVDNIDEYIRQSQTMDMDYILKSLKILTDADSQAKWSARPRIILEMAVIRLANLEDDLSLEERVRRLEEGLLSMKEKEKKFSKTVPEFTRERIPAREDDKKDSKLDKVVEKKVAVKKEDKEKQLKPGKVLDDGEGLILETIIREWPKVLLEIQKKDIKIHAFAIEGEPLSFEDNLLAIGYKEGFGFHQQAINKENRKKLVEEVVSQYFNKNIRINFLIYNNTIKDKEIKEEEKKDENKDKAIEKALDFFGKDIVEIK